MFNFCRIHWHQNWPKLAKTTRHGFMTCTEIHTFPYISLCSHLHLASWCWNFPATFCNSLFASWSWCAQHSCVSNLCVCVFLLLVLLFRLLFEDPTFLQGSPDPDLIPLGAWKRCLACFLACVEALGLRVAPPKQCASYVWHILHCLTV